MENFSQGFKSNLGGSILKLTMKSWLLIGLVTVISTLVSQGISYLLTPSGPGIEEWILMMQNPEILMDMANDPMALAQLMGGGAQMGLGMSLLIMLIGLTISSWAWNANFMVSAHKVTGAYANFGEVLGKSFNGNIFKLLGLTLLMIVIAIVLGLVMGLITMAVPNFIVMIILLILMIAVLLMFGLIPPAIVIGKMSFGEAFSYSFRHMKFGRALVLALIFIGILIVIGLLSFGVMYSVIGTGSMGAIMGVGGLYILLLATFMNSLYASIFGGLYYKYSNEEGGEMDLEDHLISDNG